MPLLTFWSYFVKLSDDGSDKQALLDALFDDDGFQEVAVKSTGASRRTNTFYGRLRITLAPVQLFYKAPITRYCDS